MGLAGCVAEPAAADGPGTLYLPAEGTSRVGDEGAMVSTPEDRSPFAVAYQWAWRIIHVSLEMVVPGLIGLWLDRKLGTRVLFTLLCFAFGMTGGIWHLIHMTRRDGTNVCVQERERLDK